jgi:hypothetical protein
MRKISSYFLPAERTRPHTPSPVPLPLPGPTEVDVQHLAPELDTAYYSEATASEASEGDDSNSDTAEIAVTPATQSPPRKRKYVDKRLPAICPLSKREKREQKLAAENRVITGYVTELEKRLKNWRVRDTMNT